MSFAGILGILALFLVLMLLLAPINLAVLLIAIALENFKKDNQDV